MGEMEPVARIVASLDLGESAIDTNNVIMPTSERRTGFTIEQTSEGTWSRFDLKSTQRNISIEPSTVGVDEFNDLCDDVAAMYATAEGQAVLARLTAIAEAKPLEIKASVGEIVT